jgi:uncharacterized membrane protein
MRTSETTVVVDLPVRTVYDQWTQFEEFPEFMGHVDEVRQLDDAHLRWRASIYGVTREWDAEVTEQVPDRRIAWRAVDGTQNAGQVAFEPVDKEHTKVTLALVVDPHGVGERLATATGIVEDRAESDLKDFKRFIEDRERQTGGWRGRIEDGERLDARATSTRASASARSDDLETVTRDELYRRAQAKGIKGRSKLTKAQLVKALRSS